MYLLASPSVALQKLQGLVVELLDIFVDWCMRTPFKDNHLGVADCPLHPACKTGGSRNVVPPESYQSWTFDPTKLRFSIMSYHGA